MRSNSATSSTSHSPRRAPSSSAKVLVLDFGTSYFKVALFNQRCELNALKSVPVPTDGYQDGRVELPVSVFRDLITQAVRSFGTQFGGLKEVRAISFATQANS